MWVEICRAALGSRARTYMANVYDLNPSSFGTFDLVMFFGVLYHLRHPILALQKIATYTYSEFYKNSSGALWIQEQ